ncbi:MAG TPA: glycoside hydrolase 100 family protein [Myxococcota bacterium]|nr:glycoside hydrolase 100 family protein [Myxococcota bacterium]
MLEPDDRLRGLAVHELRNEPGRYHNGGLWPMVNGFWAMAARRLGEDDIAETLLEAVRRANERGFPEYLDARTGEPGGARGQAWSAAGELLATATFRTG